MKLTDGTGGVWTYKTSHAINPSLFLGRTAGSLRRDNGEAIFTLGGEHFPPDEVPNDWKLYAIGEDQTLVWAASLKDALGEAP